MRNILIIGATSDMGKAFSRECASKEMNIILTGRNKESLESLSRDLSVRTDSRIESLVLDILDTKNHLSFYENLSFKIDAVACFVGLLGDEEKCRNSFDYAKNILDTNFISIVSLFNIIANDFEKREYGVLIAITSVAGERGRATTCHYGSAKAGLTTYLSALRNRLYKYHVQVINVKSGYCRTKMTEELDLSPILTCEPEDVSSAIFRAIKYKQDIIYVNWLWRWVMILIRFLPERFFKKMKL